MFKLKEYYMICRLLSAQYIKVLLVFLVVMMSGNAALAEEETPQVLMIGLFHFSNPGLDKVKTEAFNVLEEEPQQYLEELTQRIAEEFKPTLVLLEYDEDDDEATQERYANYVKGSHALSVNETEQMGFRIAKKAGAAIASFDDRTVPWKADALFHVLPEVAPDTATMMDKLIEDITNEINEKQRTMTLGELLSVYNEPEFDRKNMDFYLLTNAVASEGNHEGVDATASWWERNFRMYAKIQKHAKPGERIVVIGGQGHTAILKNLLEIDTRLKAVDVRPFL